MPLEDYEFSLENQGPDTTYNEENWIKSGVLYMRPESITDSMAASRVWNIILESSTVGSTDYYLAETDEAGLSILAEDSDAYYSFFIIQ